MNWAETPLDAGGQWATYGVPDPDIVIAGHSHVFTMVEAIKAGHGLRDRRAAVAYTASTGSRVIPDREYWDCVANIAEGKVLAIAWRGNQHAGFVIDGKPPVRLATSLDVDKSIQVIPEEMVRELWRSSLDALGVYLTRMRPVSRLFVLGTPAPRSSEACLEVLWRDSYFKDFIAVENIAAEEVQIAPAVLRLRLWSILQDLTRQTAEANGAVFVPSSPQSVGADGLLRQEFYGRDLSHANATYGALMWAELDAALDQHEVNA